MCGIIGYIGNKNTKDILINGLKKLEYRGYDSAGIAILNEKISIFKAKGKIKNLEASIDEKSDTSGGIGIGHTRWATHGIPNELNSHPHFSNDGKIAVVHNGIIENYTEIKGKLQKDGYKFISETDTEVIVHLYHSYYNGDMLEALKNVLKDIKGSYALCIVCEDEKDKILVARKDSPLVIGVGEGENFIASDIPAILENTKNYYFLEDMEMAIIQKDSIKIFDNDKKLIEKKVFTVDWDISLAEKNGYDYFMMKEIMEQPECIKKCINSYSLNDISFEKFSINDEEIKNINTIHIVACGSAWHAGMVGKYIIEDLCRIPVNLDIASEFRYKNPIINKNDICIIISQSGETADTLAALREAKEKGAKTISIVNVVGSSIARESDEVIYTLAGPEIAVATTKGYSTQMSVLYMLCLKIAYIRGKINKEELNKNIEQLKNIAPLMQELFKDENIYKNIAKKYYNIENAFLIGRGLDYAIALESALKLKEISYIHTEAYPAGELKHGSIALIEEGTVVFGIITQDKFIEKTISNLKEVKSRGAKIVIITKKTYGNFEEIADDVIYIPEIDEKFMASIAIVPMQILSYYIAINRGCDIDMPRNLAKSVTVE